MSDRIAEIRERLEKAAPGPWGIAPWHDCTVGSKAWLDWDARDIVGEDHPEGEFNAITTSTQADAEFIAHAPDDIAFLLARLSAITDALDREKLAEICRVAMRDAMNTYGPFPFDEQGAHIADAVRRHVFGKEER